MAAAHPHKIYNMLNEDRHCVTSDGFIARFLLACPMPKKMELDELINLGEKKTLLPCLLATIKIIHTNSNNLNYKIDKEGFDLLCTSIKEYNYIADKYESKEPIIR